MRFARLVTYYWSHHAWLEDDEILAGVAGPRGAGRGDRALRRYSSGSGIHRCAQDASSSNAGRRSRPISVR